MQEPPATEPLLREGHDFASAEELRGLSGDVPARTVEVGAGERLAEAIALEVRWLMLTGALPGGAPWDAQPAWRVGLWEHLISEQQRAEMLASLMR